MKTSKFKKTVIVSVILIAVIAITFAVIEYLLNKYSIPNKEDRLNNLVSTYGTSDLTKIDQTLLADDIVAALSKYTNWDNLFLSDNFKEKYKNRESIIEDSQNIKTVTGGLSSEYDNVVIIFAARKNAFWDTDESDDITTKYYFRYELNDMGEIDDLILINKQDVYTIDGNPVD